MLLIEEERRTGKPNAVNLILATCDTALLTLVDGDIRLSADCIGSMLQELADARVGCVGASRIVCNSEDGEIATLAATILRVMQRAMNELSDQNQLAFVMGEACCFRTKPVGKIPEGIVNDDAYIATALRNRGFRIVLSRSARFVARVPTSIHDFVAQRRRVAFGHAQIRSRMRRYGTSMEGIAVCHPRALLRAVLGEMAARPSSAIRAILIGELEIMSRLLACVDRITGREHSIWRRIETSKPIAICPRSTLDK
jgi:cellulose synthase/poly-beta-1,6-N-acetylglucosamine synthase-like glycosyltransferase